MDLITIYFNGSQRVLSSTQLIEEFVVPKSTSFDSITVLADGEIAPIVELKTNLMNQLNSEVAVHKDGQTYIGELLDSDEDTATLKVGTECGYLIKIRHYDKIVSTCGYV